jgi:putative endonuclease
MTRKRKRFGKSGEQAAVVFLKKQGYRILEKNYRVPVGEVDIIAEHKKKVVFVEVKSRADGEYEAPIEAVTPHKQHKIIQTAQIFLARNKIVDRAIRFDVVSISGDPDSPESWTLELVADAFRA